jgi:hypothetical protein
MKNKFKFSVEFTDNTLITIEREFSKIPNDRSGWRRAKEFENILFDLKRDAGSVNVLVRRVETEKYNLIGEQN